MIQVLRDYTGKVDSLVEDKKDRNDERVAAEKEAVEQQMNQNLYAQLLPAALPAPGMDSTGGTFVPGTIPPRGMAGYGSDSISPGGYMPQQQGYF
jgi:clathrin heavy chain